MSACDPAHAGHRRYGRGNWTRGQIDDPLAVRPGTGDAQRRTFADQEAIARTADVFFAWRRISDWLE